MGSMKGSGGEIVEVQGGHIVRSTGRKDRHSKVCTAKGPRDRRVRLSAHTAIQFYDVQDRLGYDRPSKAVDWLITNAKAAIDELAELPAWHPTTTTMPSASESNHQDDIQSPTGQRHMLVGEPVVSVDYGLGGTGSTTSFHTPMHDAISDNIKTFFPIATASRPPIGYQNYPLDLLSRTTSQDLRLSLQSFRDPIFNPPHHALFTSSAPLAFEAGWPEQTQRMIPWNVTETGGSAGGYVLNLPQPQVPGHGHGQLFSQRGPLQSSSSPSLRAWADPIQPPPHALYPSVSSMGFASGGGGAFSGFRIPARIQGEEEEQDGVSDKPPSSASSASRH